MIIYTLSLKKWVKQTMLPRLIPDIQNYIIIGSFGKKYPYVTTIQIVVLSHKKKIDNYIQNLPYKPYSIIQTNNHLFLKYFIIIDSIPIESNIIVCFDTDTFNTIYTKYEEDKQNISEFEYIIEKKFGLYKQLIVLIQTYNLLFTEGNLSVGLSKSMIFHILQDIDMGIPDISHNLLQKIRNNAVNSDTLDKICQWNILLNFLRNELILILNMKLKNYFENPDKKSNLD